MAATRSWNKYTPPSIFQELAWTKRIMERDRAVTMEDVEPLLLDLGEGRVVDLQHRLTNQYGVTRDEALAQRRDLYRLFENAFDSEVVVITLGLIECWFDRKTGQYVEFGPFMRKHNDGGRFVFRRLGFHEAYDFTNHALDLLGARNVLLTTSPVPLARTFTSDDVIVANTYSKSVLRAVAGEIAQARPNVDYFPSYESVMLTKQNYVWAEDLTHVDGAFVGRIVSRMSERYVEDTAALPDTAALDKWLRFTGLADHRQFGDAGIERRRTARPVERSHLSTLPPRCPTPRRSTNGCVSRVSRTTASSTEAAALFESLDLSYVEQSARFALAVAELQMHLGQHDAAAANVAHARNKAETAGERGCLDLLL